MIVVHSGELLFIMVQQWSIRDIQTQPNIKIKNRIHGTMLANNARRNSLGGMVFGSVYLALPSKYQDVYPFDFSSPHSLLIYFQDLQPSDHLTKTKPCTKHPQLETWTGHRQPFPGSLVDRQDAKSEKCKKTSPRPELLGKSSREINPKPGKCGSGRFPNRSRFSLYTASQSKIKSSDRNENTHLKPEHVELQISEDLESCDEKMYALDILLDYTWQFRPTGVVIPRLSRQKDVELFQLSSHLRCLQWLGMRVHFR